MPETLSVETLEETPTGVSCQTELTGLQIFQMEQCNRDMTCELLDLKKKLLEADLTEASFQGNEEKTKFYTGLPSFLVLQQIISEFSSRSIVQLTILG